MLSPLYAITDTKLAGFSHPEIVYQLLQGGCRLIQIRDKQLSDAQFLPQLMECVNLCHRARAIILVNDRPDMAALAQTDGVHLGQEDTSPGSARQALGPARLIGRSAYNLEQALEAEQDPNVDYIALGPVFATLTKIINQCPVGLAGVKEVRSRVKKPLVSIGGINLDNAVEVIMAGADSVAVISDLMGSPPSIAGRTEAFLARLRSLK